MIKRVQTIEELLEGISEFEELLKGIDVPGWFTSNGNFALREGNDFALFNVDRPGLYTGHYFFKSRGKEAKEVAKKILDEVFTNHGAQIIQGITPVEKRAARWMSRQLGFQSHGLTNTILGPCELFYLTKEQHQNG